MRGLRRGDCPRPEEHPHPCSSDRIVVQFVIIVNAIFNSQDWIRGEFTESAEEFVTHFQEL